MPVLDKHGRPWTPDGNEPAAAPQRVRLEFRPDGQNALTSLWAAVKSREPGRAVFALEHDHPALGLQPGWHVACRLGRFEVLSVHGREITCAELK